MKRLLAFLQGFRECHDSLGMTWDHPNTPQSRWYDRGRAFGQRWRP